MQGNFHLSVIHERILHVIKTFIVIIIYVNFTALYIALAFYVIIKSRKWIFHQLPGDEAVSTAGEAKPRQEAVAPTHQPTHPLTCRLARTFLTLKEWRAAKLNIYQKLVLAKKLYLLRLNKYFYHNSENNSFVQSFTSNGDVWHGQEGDHSLSRKDWLITLGQRYIFSKIPIS